MEPGAKAMLGEQRAAFDVPPEIAYFNTANLAPQLHAVRAAGEAALERRARPWTIAAEDWFTDVERLRDAVRAARRRRRGRRGARAGDELRLRRRRPQPPPAGAGQRVLVLAEEYPSGIYTWRAAARRCGAELLTVAREHRARPGPTRCSPPRRACRRSSACRTCTGPTAPSSTSRRRGPQPRAGRAAGHRRQPVGRRDAARRRRLRPDFVVAVGYKWLLGPFGVGYLYVAEEHRQGEPIEENWILRAGSEDFARLVDYRDEYQPGARRFDVGQRTQFELTPMAIAALEQLPSWEVPRVAATLAARHRRRSPRARPSSASTRCPTTQRGPHLLGVRLPETVRARVLPALAAADCFAAVRGASLRIAPHLHTTDADVERLVGALALAMGGELD